MFAKYKPRINNICLRVTKSGHCICVTKANETRKFKKVKDIINNEEKEPDKLI